MIKVPFLLSLTLLLVQKKFGSASNESNGKFEAPTEKFHKSEYVNHQQTRDDRRHIKEQSYMQPSRTNLPSPRSDLSTALALSPNDEGDLNMGIYLMGGCEYYGSFSVSLDENNEDEQKEECAAVADNMWVYEPYDDIFISRRKMPIPRYRHISVSVEGDSIWVLTGRDERHNLLDQIDVYFPQKDSWITLPNRLPPDLLTSDGAGFSSGTKLIIVGGYNSMYEATGLTYVIDTVATLEKEELVYKVMSPMGTPRGDISAIVFDRFAFVVGGFTHKNGFCTPLPTTEVYDLFKNEWSYAPDLNVGRGHVSLVTFNDRIFALGGETTHLDPNAAACQQVSNPTQTTNYANKIVTKRYPVNSIEMFTPNQDEDRKQKWKLAYSAFLPPDNAVYRFVANAFPENNIIYAFGGIFHDGGISGTDPELLKTSDVVSLYFDDFKHGRFHGNKFGSSSLLPSFDDWDNVNWSHSSIIIILVGAVVIFSTCGVVATRIHLERSKRKRFKDFPIAEFNVGARTIE